MQGNEIATTMSEQIAIIISAISTLIAAISTVVALVSNHRNHEQYLNSIKPSLSMSLVEYSHLLYLHIKNTGKTAAKDIKIEILKIENNGEESALMQDDLFKSNFELYSEENVQGRVAIFGRNICQDVFPKIHIKVSYVDNNKKRTEYFRTVTYLSAYNEKINDDVNIDMRQIESSLKSLSQSNVRVSNYLDGCQVGAFDDLNILAEKTLKNDLLCALDKDIEPVKSREETIEEGINNKTTK